MADDFPKMDEVDKRPQLKTGITELDEILSGGSGRRELHIIVGAPVEHVPRWSQLMGRTSERDGKKTLVVDLEMGDPPDRDNTPKPGS